MQPGRTGKINGGFHLLRTVLMLFLEERGPPGHPNRLRIIFCRFTGPSLRINAAVIEKNLVTLAGTWWKIADGKDCLPIPEKQQFMEGANAYERLSRKQPAVTCPRQQKTRLDTVIKPLEMTRDSVLAGLI